MAVLTSAVDRRRRSLRLAEVDRQYRHALRRYAAGLVSDPGRADDIVQEAMVRLWKHPHLLDEPVSGLRRWLLTVTRNLAYDELRSARRRHEFAVGADTLLDRRVEDPCAGLTDTWTVRRALATLSYEHREVIVHAYYRRASTTAIAADLAIPPGTVKSRLHYAVRALGAACAAQGVTTAG